MIIKALVNAWRSGKQMRHMYDEFMAMLKATEWMFGVTGQVLLEGRDPKEMELDLYETDRRVNKTERQIRKELVEHLAIRPQGDVPACLVLMSIVKDAERVGDYCKNLYEIRGILGSHFTDADVAQELKAYHEHVMATFRDTQQALAEGDDTLAHNIVGREKETASTLDAKVCAVAESDAPTRQAVCHALALRHMKRIHAHLCNIASSVARPVHKIDYPGKGPISPDEKNFKT